MSKEPKDKTPPPVSTAQPPEQSSKARVFRELSPEEARERGIPIRNELIISPVPRKGSKDQIDGGHQ
jgi:hypothetical protein